MEWWQWLLITFLIVFAYKLLSNVISLFKTKHFIELHLKYIVEQNFDISVYQPSFEKLLKRANIKDSFVAEAEPIGYGHIVTRNISVMLNIQSKRQDIASLVNHQLIRAKGVYSLRIKECFSPIYWIECIVFMPRHLLDYLGIDKDKVGYKLSNVLLTFIWWSIGAAVAIFRDEIRNIIVQFASDKK